MLNFRPLRRSHRHALVGTLLASGVTGLALLPTSGGAAQLRHIPGNGNGAAVTTAGPDLRSVTLDAGNSLTDSIGERAHFCFDSNIKSAGGSFVLMGYDARRWWTGDAVVQSDNSACALVTFPAGSDLQQATVGQVGPGAVTDASNKGNIVASEPVQGSTVKPAAGATTGPDLAGVSINAQDAAHKLVTFTYDENLNPSPSRGAGDSAINGYQASDFSYVPASGAPVSATAGTVQANGASVTVDFGAAPVENAVRFASSAGAVEDRPATTVQPGSGLARVTPSPPAVVNTAQPQPSGRPQLQSAAPSGPNAYLLTYSTGVTVPDNTHGFRAVADDGTVSALALTAGTGGTQNTVLVTFPDSEALTKDPGSIVRIESLNGAVVNSTDAGSTGLYGQAPTSTPNSSPGFTNGPDLLKVTTDPGTQRTTFTYDESLAPSPAAGGFAAFRSDGSGITGQGAPTTSSNTAIVPFGASIGDFVAYGQGYGGVSDPSGRPSPNQSVSTTIETAATPPSAPPSTPAKPTRKKAKTLVSFRHVGKRFSGTVSAYVKTCKYNRTVILRKKGKSTTRYGTARSLSNGRWGLTKRFPTKGTYYVFVLAKKTSKYSCGSVTSKKTVKIK